MHRIIWVAVFIFALQPTKAFAADAEVINQLKFFYGQISIEPKDINAANTAAGLGEFTKLTQFGIEADRDIGNSFNFGLRLDLKLARVEASNWSATNDYHASLNQSNLRAMFNFPLVKQERFKAEAFTGFGVSATNYTLKTATEDGQLQSGQSGPSALIGAAVAFGYKYVFLKIEGGYEYNKISNFNKTGTITTSIDSLNLSGGYFNVGILIDGLKLGRL